MARRRRSTSKTSRRPRDCYGRFLTKGSRHQSRSMCSGKSRSRSRSRSAPRSRSRSRSYKPRTYTRRATSKTGGSKGGWHYRDGLRGAVNRVAEHLMVQKDDGKWGIRPEFMQVTGGNLGFEDESKNAAFKEKYKKTYDVETASETSDDSTLSTSTIEQWAKK